MTLTPEDVGHRVVVRIRVPGETGPSGGPALTDVTGTLLAWEQGALVVRRRDEEVVRLPTALVVAAKRIPPRPPSRA